MYCQCIGLLADATIDHQVVGSIYHQIDCISLKEGSMSGLKDLNVADEQWLRVIYTEAWNQYAHEDNLAQGRNNFFMGLQAALIALWTAFLKPLYEIGEVSIGSYTMHLGLLLLGGSTFLIGLFSFLLTWNWKAATQAGQRYLNLRWMPIIAIEKLAQIHRFGIATLEHEWKQLSEIHPNEPYRPFENIEGLEKCQLKPNTKVRGWSSMLNVISFWLIICGVLVVAGIVLMIVGLII